MFISLVILLHQQLPTLCPVQAELWTGIGYKELIRTASPCVGRSSMALRGADTIGKTNIPWCAAGSSRVHKARMVMSC